MLRLFLYIMIVVSHRWRASSPNASIQRLLHVIKLRCGALQKHSNGRDLHAKSSILVVSTMAKDTKDGMPGLWNYHASVKSRKRRIVLFGHRYVKKKSYREVCEYAPPYSRSCGGGDCPCTASNDLFARRAVPNPNGRPLDGVLKA